MKSPNRPVLARAAALGAGLVLLSPLGPAGCDGDASPATADASDTGDTAPSDPDLVVYSCLDPSWAPATCEPGVTTDQADAGAGHISSPEPIVYADNPPSSGDHRGQWARWGEYEFLPPQRWLHNLEHGGVAYLYHPCAAADVVDALRAHARARADDDGGPFRWVLTPYPGLETTVAVVAWGHTYAAHCVDEAEITAFVDAWYRQAPEDVAGDGPFADLHMGR